MIPSPRAAQGNTPAFPGSTVNIPANGRLAEALSIVVQSQIGANAVVDQDVKRLFVAPRASLLVGDEARFEGRTIIEGGITIGGPVASRPLRAPIRGTLTITATGNDGVFLRATGSIDVHGAAALPLGQGGGRTNITGTGNLVLGGGTIATSRLTVGATATLRGFGTVDGPVTNRGTTFVGYSGSTFGGDAANSGVLRVTESFTNTNRIDFYVGTGATSSMTVGTVATFGLGARMARDLRF